MKIKKNNFTKYEEIVLDNITFSKVKKVVDVKYLNIKYNKSDIIFESCDLKFVESYRNNNEEFYILKFIINDNDFTNFIKDIDNLSINKCINSKDLIFNENFDDSNIRNLFFTNIYKDHTDNNTYINIRSTEICKFKKDEIYKILIKLVGIWVYKDMYGITYEYFKNNI